MYLKIAKLSLFSFLALMTQFVSAQCDTTHLFKHLEDGNYEKSKTYHWESTDSDAPDQYSYQLVAGKTYVIMLYAKGGNQQSEFKVVLTDHKDRTKATSYYKGKYYKSLTFFCRKSGRYTLSFTYDRQTPFCGVATMGTE